MRRRNFLYRRRVGTKDVLNSYADIAPLLAMGRGEEVRALLRDKYRIGPTTLFSKDRPVAAYWLEKLGDLQYAYYVENCKEKGSFFEKQTIRSTYQSLSDLVKEFVMEVKEPAHDTTNRTLLHHAAYFQLTGICEYLLAQKYDPNEESNGNETPAYEALTGFEYLPLSYDEDYDPFRVKELFRTLLDAGADPYFPVQSAKSVNMRLRRLTKWIDFLATTGEAQADVSIPDLERKVDLLRICYVDVMEAHRLKNLRGDR